MGLHTITCRKHCSDESPLTTERMNIVTYDDELYFFPSLYIIVVMSRRLMSKPRCQSVYTLLPTPHGIEA